MMSLLLRLDPLIRIYVGFLVCVWLVPAASMLAQYRRGRRAILDAARAIAAAGEATGAERRHGRSDVAVGRLRGAVNELQGDVAEVWRGVDEAIERYEGPDGEVGHFLTRGVDDLLPVEAVIERHYNSSEFAAVPGVLTSLGLLGTFIALLLGLNGLRVDENGGAVHGLDVLIGNLSGKFLSSIVALGLSVAFLGLEMLVCQRGLRAAHARLVRAVARALPFLSSSRLLLDAQRQAARQTTAITKMGSDVAERVSTALEHKLRQLQPSEARGDRLAALETQLTRLADASSDERKEMTGALTAAVAELSDRLAKLSGELVGAIGSAAERSQQAAAAATRQAGDWSSRASQQLAAVMAPMGERAAELDRTGRTMIEAQQVLRATLAQTVDALGAMRGAAADVRGYTGNFTALQKQLEEGQRAQNKIATLAHESIARLTDTAARNDEFLVRQRATIEQYRELFDRTDDQLASILDTILERLNRYNHMVAENFDVIVKSANEVMPRMANVLKQGTDELKENIEELNDALSKGTERLTANAA